MTSQRHLATNQPSFSNFCWKLVATLVRTHLNSRIVNRRQIQIFSMINISRATHRRFPQITSLIIYTAWLSLAWTSTDLPPISGICRRFIKTCWRVKNRAKIVQCELGITLNTVWILILNVTCLSRRAESFMFSFLSFSGRSSDIRSGQDEPASGGGQRSVQEETGQRDDWRLVAVWRRRWAWILLTSRLSSSLSVTVMFLVVLQVSRFSCLIFWPRGRNGETASSGSSSPASLNASNRTKRSMSEYTQKQTLTPADGCWLVTSVGE